MFRSAVAASMAGALAFTLQGCSGGSPEFTMDCGGECSVTYSCSGGKASAGCTSGTELTSGEITGGRTCDSYVNYMKLRYEDADTKKDECDKITAPLEYVMDCGGDCNVTYSCSGGKASAGCASGSKLTDLSFLFDGHPCHSYVDHMKHRYEDSLSKKEECDTITAPPPTPPPTEYVVDCGGGCSVTFACGSDLIKQGKVSSGCTSPDRLTYKPERARDEENCDMYPSLMRTMFNIGGPGMKENQCRQLLRPARDSEVATVIDDSNAAGGSSATRSDSVPPFALEKVLYMALGGAVAVAVFLLVRAVNAALHAPCQARDAKPADPIELVQVQQPSSATAGVP